MRRLIAVGAIALLVLAVVPLTSAGTTVTTKHVDGSVRVIEPNSGSEWLARFEVRTVSGAVEFGYFELYGITPDLNLGQIHVFDVSGVDYYRTLTGARGATLHMDECIMIPETPCAYSPYEVSDGGADDTFMPELDWEIESGNISIYTTGGQNTQ